MDSLPPLHRAYYTYLSRAYGAVYSLHRRTFIGIRLATLVRWMPIILLLVGWLRRWPMWLMVGLVAGTIWLFYSLWQAKRDNFKRFVPDKQKNLLGDTLVPLPPNQRVSVQATGLFSVSGRETNLLLRPADYWRFPLGEHVVMAEERPGKFLYQFFGANNLQMVQYGWLLSGPQPLETLAITFLARWGPEYTQFGQSHENGNQSNGPPPKRLTIFLSAVEPETLQAVWHTVVDDARQARLEKQ